MIKSLFPLVLEITRGDRVSQSLWWEQSPELPMTLPSAFVLLRMPSIFVQQLSSLFGEFRFLSLFNSAFQLRLNSMTLKLTSRLVVSSSENSSVKNTRNRAVVFNYWQGQQLHWKPPRVFANWPTWISKITIFYAPKTHTLLTAKNMILSLIKLDLKTCCQL